jgi:hypothetical protein
MSATQTTVFGQGSQAVVLAESAICAYCTEVDLRVLNDSMLPTFQPTTQLKAIWVSLKEWSVLPKGVYVVTTGHGTLLGRVKESSHSEEFLMLHFDNPNYQSVLLPFDDIDCIWRIDNENSIGC